MKKNSDESGAVRLQTVPTNALKTDLTPSKSPQELKSQSGPNTASNRFYDEVDSKKDNTLNVISVDSSSIDGGSLKDEDQLKYDNSGTYSTFHDSGGSIQDPTSYILQTDSDEYSYSDQKTDMVATAAAADEEDNAQTGIVSTSSTNATSVPKSSSSVYSSQDTLRISSNATPLPETPQRLLNDTYGLQITQPVVRKLENPTIAKYSSFSRNEAYEADISQVQTTIRSGITANPNVSDPNQDATNVTNAQTPGQNLNQNSASSQHTTSNSNILDWDSAIPALMYTSNNYNNDINPVDDNNLTSRQELQGVLIRGNSIAGDRDYLNAIKSSLSRNRSMKSTKFAAASNSNSPPLLFSQDKNSMSRSLSTLRPSEGQGNGQVFEEKLQDEDENGNNDFKNDDESLVEEDREYAPVTNCTELNCLKHSDRKFLKSANKELPPLFQNNQTKDLAQNNKDRDGYDKERKRPGDLITRFKKVTSEKRYSIVIWVLFMIIMSLICVFVPLLIVYSRGSDSVVERYLDNISSSHRDALLNKLGFNSLNTELDMKSLNNQIIVANGTLINSTTSTSQYANDGITVAGISKFENFPLKYQRAEEMQEVMNSAKSLKNVFYGIDYAPRNIIYPICGATLHEVMLDVALLSQVTSRIRTYSTQCNQARMILDSIKTLGLNVSLSMGVWIGPDDNINQQQLKDMKNILKEYPRKHFESIYIGNEVLFREEQPAEALINYIEESKDYVHNVLKWDLPVGTSELGSKANPKVMEVSDIFGSNTHPFFSGFNVQLATKWVYDFVKYQVEPLNEQFGDEKSPQIVISEIGWPYQGGKYKKAIAGKRHMQYFLNSWVCEARQREYPWYFFEAFDEPWKQVYHKENAKWETEWGLFTADRKLKEGITIPSCSL